MLRSFSLKTSCKMEVNKFFFFTKKTTHLKVRLYYLIIMIKWLDFTVDCTSLLHCILINFLLLMLLLFFSGRAMQLFSDRCTARDVFHWTQSSETCWILLPTWNMQFTDSFLFFTITQSQCIFWFIREWEYSINVKSPYQVSWCFLRTK